MNTTSLIIVALVLAFITTATAEPMPLPKSGQCPAGYASEASYCVPMRRDTPVALPKTGQCPSGFTQSGNYCIEMRKR